VARSRAHTRECPSGRPTDRRAVERYYEESWLDTRVLWQGGRHLGIHLGYWEAGVRSHSASVLAMNRAMADRAMVRRGERVLDAGCGVGGSAIWLARELAAKVTAIDISAAQVDRARRYARRRGVDALVDVRRLDAAATSLPSESFDVAWAQESLCHAADKEAFLVELARVLRPGGRLIIEDAFLRSAANEQAARRQLDSWCSGLALPGLLSGDELIDAAGRAGLVEVELEDVTEAVRPSVARMRLLVGVCAPFASALRAVRLRSAVQAGHVSGLKAMCTAFDDGVWFPAIGLARKPLAVGARA
jgi:tocopherol O-methyltransferase